MRLSDCGDFKVRYEQEAALFPNDVGRLALGAFLIVWFLAVPALAGPYLLTIINLTVLGVIGATGLNLLTGYTGQITIGHGAFMGVGAHAAAILAASVHLPFWLAVPFAGVFTAGVGAFFGIPSLRLKGLYLAIATLAVQFILDPDTGQAVPPGSPGEVVISLLDPPYALFRFGTSDLAAPLPGPCPCGRTAPRLAGILGRAGDAVK